MVGAVGAIGGIVVGLTSVFALFQIDRQVEAAFDRQFAAYQQQLRDESARWATGLRFWTQSMMDVADGNLDRAQQALRLALEAWPEAPGARAEMTHRLWEAQQRAHVFWLRPGRAHDINLSVAFERAIPTPTQPRWEDTFAWWQLAVDHEPEAMPELAPIGAGLYALVGNVDQMVTWIARSLALRPGWNPNDDDLLTWGYSWNSVDVVMRVQALFPPGAAVTLDSHRVFEQLAVEAAEAAASRPSSIFQYWLVVPKRSRGPFVPVVRIVSVNTYGQGQWSMGRYSLDGKQIGEQHDVLDDDAGFRAALDQYMFVGQIPTDHWTVTE